MAKKLALSKTKPANNEVRQFRKAAASYLSDTTSSKAKAEETLKRLGVYTPSGNLAGKYK